MPDLASWPGIVAACWLLVEALTRLFPRAKKHAAQLPLFLAPGLAASAKASGLGWEHDPWGQIILLGIFAGAGARITHEKIVRAFWSPRGDHPGHDPPQ